MNDEQLREIAKRHAREAVAPIGSRGHERLQAANGLPGAEAILQNIRRQEEVIFYALKEASEHSKSGTNEDALLEDVDRMRAKIHRMAEVLRRAKSTLEIGREFAHDREEMVNNWSGHADIVERMIDEALAYVPSEPHKPWPSHVHRYERQFSGEIACLCGATPGTAHSDSSADSN